MPPQSIQLVDEWLKSKLGQILRELPDESSVYHGLHCRGFDPMRILILAVVLVIGASGAAWARCADDFKELQTRVDHERHRQPPSPQAVAAAKELNKASQNMNNMDEIDCYN